MGLFDRKKKKDLLYEGVQGAAVVRQVGDAKYHSDEHDVHLSDFGIGNMRYPFVLEVTLDDGRPPYVVERVFKVPASIYSVAEGSTLPVWADPDDPQVVEINWDGFVASGGADVPGVSAQQVHDAMPDESRTMMLDGWVQATKLGAMTREGFDEAVAGAQSAGLLTAAEADAARAALG